MVVATTVVANSLPPSTRVRPEIAAFVRELVIRQDSEAPVVSRWLPKLITSRPKCAPDLWSYRDSNSGPLACHATMAVVWMRLG